MGARRDDGMKVIAAPDKFRGTATAADVAAAVRDGVASAHGEAGSCVELPVADGGEGTLAALGGPNRTTTVTGPLGDPVDVPWRLRGRVAVVEMALASGLELVGGPEGNDPMAASTYGTGELIALAAESGARRVIVGVGGSATTDGGLGALRAMYPLHRFKGVRLQVACDVRTPFVDAAEVFAPQKGASPAQVKLLRRRLERLRDDYLSTHGVDVAELVGGGAAGGLAGGLAAAGAELVAGFDLVADEVGLYDEIETGDLVVTGEGFVDAESFNGKVVGGVIDLASDCGVPVLVVAGEVLDEARDLVPEGVTVVSLAERYGVDRAVAETSALVRDAVADHLRSI